MDAREQTLNILDRIWVKLQGLPNANSLELGAFLVLLTFILVVLLITVVTCASFCCGCCSCCCRKRKLKGSDLWAKTETTARAPHSESWSCFRNTHTQKNCTGCMLCCAALKNLSPWTIKHLPNTVKDVLQRCQTHLLKSTGFQESLHSLEHHCTRRGNNDPWGQGRANSSCVWIRQKRRGPCKTEHVYKTNFRQTVRNDWESPIGFFSPLRAF